MSLSLLISRIWDFLLEICWSLLIGKNTWVDWNNTSLNNIIKTLLEKIQLISCTNRKLTILLNNRLYHRTTFHRLLLCLIHLKAAKRRLFLSWFLIHWKTTKRRLLFSWLLIHWKTTKRWLILSWLFRILLSIAHFKSSERSSSTFTKRWFFRFFWLFLSSWLRSHFKRAKSRNTRTLILFNFFLFNFFNSWPVTSKSIIDSITFFNFLLVIICLHWSLHEMLHCFL